MNKIKPLPRDAEGRYKRQFKAAGKTYFIRSAAEGFSIERFNQYEILSLALGYGATFQQFTQQLNAAIALANDAAVGKATFVDLVLQLDAIKQGINTSSQQRNSMALTMCTLFIVEKEEDLTQWSEEMAAEKIENWNKEGYDVNDFLVIALSSVAGFSEIFREAKRKGVTPLEEQLGAFLDSTELKKEAE